MVTGYRKTILKNICWSVIGKLANIGGVLLTGILIARYLGAEQYGLMNYVISYIAIFITISILGLDAIEVREFSKLSNSNRIYEILGTSLGLRAVSSFFTFALALLISMFIPEASKIIDFIFIYALCLFPNIFNNIRNFYFAKLENEKVVKAEVVRTLLGMSFKFILLWCHATLVWFIIAMSLDFFLVATGYISSFIKDGYDFRNFSFSKSLAIKLFSESLPLLISSLTVIIYHKIDQLMLGNMIDMKALGLYAVAVRLVDVVAVIPTIIVQTVTPVLVRKKETDKSTYKKNRLAFLGMMEWISIILSLGTLIIAYPMVRYSYGIQYVMAVPILQILIWKIVGMTMAAASGQLIILDSIQKWVVLRNIVACVLCITLNAILIKEYGLAGAAIASVLTLLFSSFVANVFIPAYKEIFIEQCKAIVYGPMILVAELKTLRINDNK